MEKKNCYFGFRLDTKTAKALKIIAEAHERDRADVLRLVIRREAERVIRSQDAALSIKAIAEVAGVESDYAAVAQQA